MDFSGFDEVVESILRCASLEGFESVDETGGKHVHFKHVHEPGAKVVGKPGQKLVIVNVRGSDTVDLPHDEFAKLACALSLSVTPDVQDLAFEWANAMVERMLAVEVAHVKGGKSEVKPSRTLSPMIPAVLMHCSEVSVYLEYGLSLKVGAYKYKKPTVGMSGISAGDHESVEKAWSDLAHRCVKRIRLMSEKIRAESKKIDI